jgi:hypothetical protein
MKIKEVACQAKIIGTVVTFGGTLLMALYKGPVVSVVRSSISHVTRQPVSDSTGGNDRWIIGTCFLLIGCAGFSAFYILQAITLRKYPAPMSLATWVCFVGAIQSFVVAFFAERHNSHAWSLGWDTRLFAPAYAVSVWSFFIFWACVHAHTIPCHCAPTICAISTYSTSIGSSINLPNFHQRLSFINCLLFMWSITTGDCYIRSPILHTRYGHQTYGTCYCNCF